MHPDIGELTLRNTSAFPERVRHCRSLLCPPNTDLSLSFIFYLLSLY
jgi:hypothetical protein